jgi:hypothetical protein
VTPLREWETFYLMVGPSEAVLTGLTFVAITLGAQMRLRGFGSGVAAYNTPTIVHFGVVLFVCTLLGSCGPAGIIYTLITMRRLRRFGTYAPVLEDWLANVVGPLIAYLALVIGVALLVGDPERALFAIGGGLALLMFLWIHNAWDMVTYMAIARVGHRVEDNEKGD